MFLQCLVWKFIHFEKIVSQKVFSCGTQETPLTVIWMYEPTIFSIGHFQGPTKVQLKSWSKRDSLSSKDSFKNQANFI